MMHTRETSVHSNTIKGRPTDAIGFLPLHFTSGSCLQYLVAPEVSELAIPGKPASPVNRASLAATDTMEPSISDLLTSSGRCDVRIGYSGSQFPGSLRIVRSILSQVSLIMAAVWLFKRVLYFERGFYAHAGPRV